MTFTVVQLTDPHIGASWSHDPTRALAAAVAAIAATLPSGPDAVIVTGDVGSTPVDAEYERARAVLDGLGAPLYVLPGNHDDRDLLRGRFAVPQADGAGLSYVAQLGPIRLVALDTQRPGHPGGQLDATRLQWLDRVLGEDRGAPTLLAMHHPPLLTGIPAMDAFAIPQDERRSLAEIVSRHRQLQLIAAGHVHRAVIGELGGARVLAIPSTDVQLALDFETDEMRFVPEAPCFAVHVLIEGRLVSHLQPVTTAPS
jgi:3',5'-cyclic AMP phosphodiesterase CpdA